jgi:hypothetical protein
VGVGAVIPVLVCSVSASGSAFSASTLPVPDRIDAIIIEASDDRQGGIHGF